MTNTTQWDVTKYGQMVERTDIVISGVSIITTKIYAYQNRYFVELWDSGYCVHFSEVME